MDEKERNGWLLSISEEESFNLPMVDWYDRIRLKRQILAQENIKSLGNQSVPGKEKVELKSNLVPLKMNQFWAPDK